MRSVIRMGTLAALALSAGCSLLTDLQGYSEEEKGTATPEGADGSALDGAQVSADGGTDSPSGTDAVADGATFCDGQNGTKLCADFDNGLITSVGSKSLGAGSIEVENGALVVSVPAGTQQATVMTKTFAVSGTSSIVCEFDYQRLAEPTGDGNILAFFKVDVAASPSGSELFELKEELPNAGRLYLGSTFADGGSVGDYPTFERISTPGKWVRVRGELSFTAQTGKGSRDGVVLSSVSVPTVPGASVKSVTISFGLVPIGAATGSPWKVAFDNIVCEF